MAKVKKRRKVNKKAQVKKRREGSKKAEVKELSRVIKEEGDKSTAAIKVIKEGSDKNMVTIKDIIEKTKKELVELTGFSSPSGIGFKKKDGNWIVTIQIIEKKSIPEGMDVMGIYEVETDQEGNILSYERKEIRRRSDVTGREEA